MSGYPPMNGGFYPPWGGLPIAGPGVPTYGPSPQQLPGALPPSAQPSQGGGRRIQATLNPSRPNGYEPWPGFDECFQSLRALLRRTIQVTDFAPHIRRGFKARSIAPKTRVVLNVPAATSAAANAAGIALGVAEGPFDNIPSGLTTPLGLTVLTPTAFGSPVALLRYQSQRGFVAIFESWGCTVEVGRADAVRLSAVVGGGPNIGTDAPDPLLSEAQEPIQQRTLLIIPDGKELQIQATGLDSGSPLLLTFALSGWIIPVRVYKDTLQSMLSLPGVGSRCSRGEDE